jgi:hypothetical protein
VTSTATAPGVAATAAPAAAGAPPAPDAPPASSTLPPPPPVAQRAAPIWEEEPDRRNLYLAIAAAVAVGVVVLLVVLLTAGGGSPAPARQPAVATTPEPPTTTTPSTPEQAPVSSSSVEQVLSEYQSDYSGENAEALRGLFSEQLSRQDGSKGAEDFSEAMRTYEKQFSELTEPRYTLSNVKVEPGTGEASAGADYSISSQNGTVTGAIGFHLVEHEGRLLIDSIHVTPSK